MHVFLTILAIVAIVLVVVMVVLYFLGKKCRRSRTNRRHRCIPHPRQQPFLSLTKADEIKRFRSSKDGFGKHTEISPWLKSTDCQS